MPSDPSDGNLSQATQLRLEEYRALNAELLERIEQHGQSTTVLFGGATLLWTAAAASQAHLLFLLFPWLAFGLALQTAANLISLREAGVYVRRHLEKPVGVLGWAHHVDRVIDKSASLGRLAAYITYVGLQAVSIIAYFPVHCLMRDQQRIPGCTTWDLSGAAWCMAAAASVAALLTALVLNHAQNFKPEVAEAHTCYMKVIACVHHLSQCWARFVRWWSS